MTSAASQNARPPMIFRWLIKWTSMSWEFARNTLSYICSFLQHNLQTERSQESNQQALPTRNNFFYHQALVSADVTTSFQKNASQGFIPVPAVFMAAQMQQLALGLFALMPVMMNHVIFQPLGQMPSASGTPTLTG
jgi:hypothetical protein